MQSSAGTALMPILRMYLSGVDTMVFMLKPARDLVSKIAISGQVMTALQDAIT